MKRWLFRITLIFLPIIFLYFYGSPKKLSLAEKNDLQFCASLSFIDCLEKVIPKICEGGCSAPEERQYLEKIFSQYRCNYSCTTELERRYPEARSEYHVLKDIYFYSFLVRENPNFMDMMLYFNIEQDGKITKIIIFSK